MEIGGGTSSLYQAAGGSVSINTSGYDLNLGAGIVDGHLLEGIRFLKATPRGTYTVGDDRIDFQLPTDIFDTSHYLLARGVGFSGIRRGIDIVAFGGAISLDYESPFFNGAKASTPAGILFLKKQIAPKWQLFSDTVASKKVTQIEALRWTPAPKTEIAFSAGVGTNSPFASVSLNMEKPHYDLKVAYIAASQAFHRINAASPLLAEPDRENILISWRPTPFLSLTGSHQNYLVPQYPSPVNARSSIDQGSVSTHFLGTQFNGTMYHSAYDLPLTGNESNHAVALTASRDFTSRVHLTSNYLSSRPRGSRPINSLVSNVSETLTSRISVNETITYSGGQTSVNFGGEFLSNLLTIDATYDTFYVPANNAQPFQQALLLDLKLKLPGHLLVHGASFVDPTGHLRYTADARTLVARNQPTKADAPIELGRYILHGCVTDSDGSPVEGAAVLIDEKPIYTDSSGCFYMRENRLRTHKLSVVLSDFLIGGNWQITSAPTTITSALEENSSEATVVVTVRKVRVISATPPDDGPPSSVGTLK